MIFHILQTSKLSPGEPFDFRLITVMIRNHLNPIYLFLFQYLFILMCI